MAEGEQVTDWNPLVIALAAVGMAIAAGVPGYLAWLQSRTNHVLLNSQSLAQHKLNAELSRWKAEQTGDEAHIKAAEAAELLYQEHKAKQDKVDAR